MTEQESSAKSRKLRTSTETMRERVERVTAKEVKSDQKKNKPRKLREQVAGTRHRAANAKIWVPFKFIGRFIIPPYLRASWRELRQVIWPTRKQTRQLTWAVIMFAAVFGAIIAVFDYGLDKLFKQVILK